MAFGLTNAHSTIDEDSEWEQSVLRPRVTKNYMKLNIERQGNWPQIVKDKYLIS